MSIKYKIDDAKKNKNLINDEIKLSRIKAKGGSGSDGGRRPGGKNRMTLDKLAKIVTDGFERQEKFNRQQLEFNKTIVNRLDRIVKVNNLKE